MKTLENTIKNMKGITLIALIVTIIVLLVLASVSVIMVTGGDSLFSKSKNTADIYDEQEAIEKMEIELDRIRIQYYADYNRDAKLQDYAVELEKNIEVEYVKLGKLIASIDVTGYSSILVKLKAYEYEFEILAEGTIGKTFKLAPITLSFNSNDGKGQVKSIDVIACKETKLPQNAFTKEGYTFVKWTTNADGTGYEYQDNEQIIIRENTTLYANWVKSGSQTFGFSESIQTFTASWTGTYTLEVWGAQGGSSYGGKGGYAKGDIKLTAGQSIYIVTGGQGKYGSSKSANYAGGYNGGGAGGKSSGSYYCGSGGGGATSITTQNRGTLNKFNEYRDEVLIVAGGGGGVVGSGYWGFDGNSAAFLTGAGGGTSGTVGKGKNTTSQPGTQNTGYAFGLGQSAINSTGGACGGEGNGGAGGGWFGGYAPQSTGDNSNASGAGGSGYTGGVLNASMQTGVRTGNGEAIISW